MEKLIFIPNEPKKKLNGIAIREEDIDMECINRIKTEGMSSVLSIRSELEFGGKAIFLSGMYTYALGLDSNNLIVLIPLKKK